MSASISLSRLQLLQAVVDFVASLTDDAIMIGLQNGVPMPPAPCVIITDAGSDLDGMNVTSYDPDAGNRTETPTRSFRAQIDCYGDSAADLSLILSTLWRSDYPNDYLPEGSAAAYASDARQLPFVNQASQYELRWSFDAIISYTPGVTVPQDFFNVVDVGLINVGVEYPPS